ncbi:DNA-binding transcriptional regulator, FadR family [Devosia lucknowensis]|uniref:DNA-binding transcriptional regulator, FadR family n=1 Tax=Devosia lucknowensis TaxID=1096929 RepID=A0A1Y6EZS6_9HYPH|nr:GntR family transcriptional regulator [Devosia lucknowensis]SMQ65723.1 DNA-binding transcriptional regulator, FadR family [Devosia lucknowensis]
MIETGGLIRSLSGRRAARNFHNFVINEIGHAIVTGTFPIGSVLASDAVMMERYGVSRTVLREALKTLEAKGLVEARPKVGTRVSPRSRWNFFDPQVLTWHFDAAPDAELYDSLFRVREALEGPMILLATRHRTAEHVRLLKYWCHQMETAGDSVEQYGLACLEVHGVIAESSRDPLLRSILGVVELTLALALTRDRAMSAEAYRKEASATFIALTAAIEGGRAEEAASLYEAIRRLDRRQAV